MRDTAFNTQYKTLLNVLSMKTKIKANFFFVDILLMLYKIFKTVLHSEPKSKKFYHTQKIKKRATNNPQTFFE